MITYNVTVSRDSGVWFAQIEGPPAHYVGATDVANYQDLDLEIRDLISGFLQNATKTSQPHAPPTANS